MLYVEFYKHKRYKTRMLEMLLMINTFNVKTLSYMINSEDINNTAS